jgi:benzoyl-CoA reductase/2-hydroxyglutaryl-CoA dehydratase subunit BcrC/BadD/HgdB
MADLVVAETTCDGKKKMFELMGEKKPMYVLELPQKVADKDAFEHWRRELEKLKMELERRFGAWISDEALREAIALMNRERSLRRTLARFMASDPPPLTGRQLLDLKSSISGIPADLAQYEAMVRELRDRAPGGAPGGAPGSAPGSAPGNPALAGRVRVMMTGVPMAAGAERVLEIVEGAGGVVVAQENCTGLKPILEDVDAGGRSPLEAIAEKYFHLPCSVMTRNDRRLESLRDLARGYRPQCVVELVWQACLTYDVEAARVKRFVEGELGLPYLRVVTDYSPGDSARIAVRVEALYETVLAKMAVRGE